MKTSLKCKFIVLGIAMVTAVAASTGMTYRAINHLQANSLHTETASLLAVKQMEIDMMHDAIHTDGRKMYDAVEKNDAQALQAAMESFKEHKERAESIFSEMDTSANSDIAAQISTIRQQFGVYFTMTEKLATAGASAANALHNFETQFSLLEESQEQAQDNIQAWKRQLLDDNSSEVTIAQLRLLGIAGISMLLSMSVSVFTLRWIFRPQGRIIDTMNRIASGDTTATIPYTERHDEMGDMARTVQVFKENAQRVIDLAREQKSQQDLASQQRRKAREDLAANFEANVKGVVEMVASAATQMDTTSKSVANIVHASKTKLGVLNSQIQGTSHNVQSVSSATSQLSSAITEISSQVARAARVTSSAVQEAQAADTTAKKLSEEAQKIGEVVEMINSIAAQINLLALNATIESARAGEAGKGFAVVASEVKNLAGQTTKATEEISQFIISIQGATSNTVGAIESIGAKIREIDEISTTIASAVEQQGAATREIANNIEQAAKSTEDVSRNATDVAQSSNETGESASQMMAATGELSRQSEFLRSEVDKFLAGVKAA